MAWFVVCAGRLSGRDAGAPRRAAATSGCMLALALGLLLIAPNLAWNYATQLRDVLAHGRQRQLGRLAAASRQGAGVLRRAVRRVRADPVRRLPRHRLARPPRSGLPEPDRLLLAFSLPIIAVILVQAFLSRAHANWAAPAYVAATRAGRSPPWCATAPGAGSRRRSRCTSACSLLIVFGTATAGRRAAAASSPIPFARTLGWRDVAEATRAELAKAAAAGQAVRRRARRTIAR